MNVSLITPVTVRQTPFTAIESPSRASPVTSGPRMVSRVTSPGSRPTISPSSSTIPVNTQYAFRASSRSSRTARSGSSAW